MSIFEAPPGIDRRVWRTRQLLAQALIDLGAERSIDAIEVGELAEMAGIGRSTFYTHFASKEDFLTGSWVNLLNMAEARLAEQAPDRDDLLPSAALFDHVAEARAFAAELPNSREYRTMMAAGEARLREVVDDNLKRLKPAWSYERRRDTAIYVAGGFMGLLRWWMESGVTQSAEHMQRAFARLAMSALEEE